MQAMFGLHSLGHQHGSVCAEQRSLAAMHSHARSVAQAPADPSLPFLLRLPPQPNRPATSTRTRTYVWCEVISVEQQRTGGDARGERRRRRRARAIAGLTEAAVDLRARPGVLQVHQAGGHARRVPTTVAKPADGPHERLTGASGLNIGQLGAARTAVRAVQEPTTTADAVDDPGEALARAPAGLGVDRAAIGGRQAFAGAQGLARARGRRAARAGRPARTGPAGTARPARAAERAPGEAARTTARVVVRIQAAAAPGESQHHESTENFAGVRHAAP